MTSEIMAFLTDLNENNNREWFNEHKKRYKEVKKQFEFLVELLIGKIAEFDEDIYGQEAKKTIFRIYRDVRFSKDKRPYKTNFGAFMVRGGRKSGNAGYYIHLEPGESFVGGGVYMPPNDTLKKIRSYIFKFTNEFKEIIYNDDFKNTFGTFIDHKLKLAPKGFPKDFEDIELLKYKSFAVGKQLSHDELNSDKLITVSIDAFKKLHPLNTYLNKAINS